MNNIETKRLLLRRFEINDAPSVLRFLSNAETSKFTGDPVRVTTLLEAERIITDIWFSEYAKNGYGRLALIEKESQELIGFCGLKYLPEFGLPDLGYRMLPPFWGRGYATESARAVVDEAVNSLGLKKLIAMTHPDNIQSQKVLLNLGFIEQDAIEYEGERCNFFHYDVP